MEAMLDKVVQQVTESLRAKGIAAPAHAALAAVQAGARKAMENKQVPASRIFLTADALQRRLATLDGGNNRVLELAANEFLTPSARDLAEEHHLAVRRAEALVGNPATPVGGSACGAAGPCAAAALGMVIERPSTKVTSAMSGLGRDGVTVVNYTQTSCWIQNTLLLCQAVGSGAVAAGVLVLPYAADAVMLANKVPGIRAVHGVRPESVTAARRHYAANVLVLEHAYATLHELRTMIRSFAQPAPAAPAAKVLMEAVKRLEGADAK